MSSIIDLVINGTLCSIKGLPPKVSDDILYIFTELTGDTELIDKIKNFPIYHVLDNYGYECRIYLGAKDSNGDIVIPRGFLSKVIPYLEKLNYRLNIITPNHLPLPELKIEDLAPHLRDYQKEAVVKAIKEKIGIIPLPTGTGKTEISIEILRQCPKGVNKLVLVPTRTLLYQTVEAIKNRLNIEVGIIGDSKFDIREITVAIPNTLDIRLKEQCPETINYCKSIYSLLVDECHDIISEPRVWRIVSLMENKVISIGLSATPWLESGMGKIMDALLGTVLLECKVADFMDAGVIETPIIKFYTVPRPPIPPSLLARVKRMSIESSYNILYNTCIVQHKTRNNLIVELVRERLKTDSGPIALVVNRVGTSNNTKTKGKKVISHSDILRNLIIEKLGVNFPLLHGGTSSSESRKIVGQLIKGELPGVIAGPAALTNGLDIPCLNSIFLCAGGKKQSDVLQRIGRVLRRFGSDGNRPLVVDFYDNIMYFRTHSENRLNVCRDTYGIDNVEIIDTSSYI